MLRNDGIIKDSALSPLRRLLASAEGRSAITGEILGVAMLPSQVAVRGMFLAKSTANTEMVALRSMLRGIASGTNDDNRGLIESEFPWVKGLRVREVSDAITLAAEPPSTYVSTAHALIPGFRQGARGRNLEPLSDEELLRHVSGVRRENPHKVRNKGNQSFLWKDYLTIMMELAEYDPEEAMRNLVDNGSFSPGVARVLIATLYMTGIRPIEAFGINVYVPRTDIRFDDDQRSLTRTSPISAIHEGLLRPISKETEVSGMSRGMTLLRNSRLTGAAPIMSIMSAKQQNANKDLRFPVRFLILDGISGSDANLLCWAAEFRNTDKSDASRKRLSNQTAAVLRAVCATDKEMRQDVTLYTFRHSFASRARITYEENECSALTGHTAVRTFRGYGEKRPKRSGTGWLPKPDPERADMIREIWNGLNITQEVINEATKEMTGQEQVISTQPEDVPTPIEDVLVVEQTNQPEEDVMVISLDDDDGIKESNL